MVKWFRILSFIFLSAFILITNQNCNVVAGDLLPVEAEGPKTNAPLDLGGSGDGQGVPGLQISHPESSMPGEEIPIQIESGGVGPFSYVYINNAGDGVGPSIDILDELFMFEIPADIAGEFCVLRITDHGTGLIYEIEIPITEDPSAGALLGGNPGALFESNDGNSDSLDILVN